MANSDEKLDKIADFLKNQESPNNEDHSYRDNKKLEKSEEALDQINKFLEDQSHFDERKENYDPESYPPDLDFALKHAKANRVAAPLTDNRTQAAEVCKCCGLPLENEDLPLCADRADFAFLGPGFPLYFELILFSVFILILMFLISGIYSIVKNYSQNDCFSYPDLKCSFTDITLLSMANKSKSFDLLTEQSWVNLASLLAIIIAIHLYRRGQNLTEKESLRGLTSPANYTIMIYNIPHGIYNDNDIKHLLNMNWNKHDNIQEIRVKKVVQAYFIGDYVNLIRLKNNLNNNKRKYLRYRKKKGKLPSHINIDEINNKINELNKKIQETAVVLNSNLEKTCGTVFVTFDTISMARSFINRYKTGYFTNFNYYCKRFCCFQKENDNIIILDNKILKFEMAKDPNDILWENLGYSYSDKMKKRIATLFATLFLLVFCFFLILAISYGKTKITNDFKNEENLGIQSGIRILSALSSIFIIFVNSCLVIFIKRFAIYEKQASTTHFNLSIARSLSLSQFINTALIMLLVHYFIGSQLGEADGLIFDMFNVFLANSIIIPLLNIFDIFYFLKLCKRRQIKKESVDSLCTQAEANTAFEGSNLDMWRKYPVLIKTMWLTALYAPLIPIGIPISIVALFIYYWVEKYLVLRRFKRPAIISASLNKEMTELLEMVPFLMAAGSMIFNEIIWDHTRLLSERLPDILGLAIGFANYCVPSEKIHRLFYKFDEEVVSEIEYDNMRINFLFEYDRCNPVTQEKAINEWMEFQKKSGNIKDTGRANVMFNEEKTHKSNNLKYLDNYARNRIFKAIPKKIEYGFESKVPVSEEQKFNGIKMLEMNKICVNNNAGMHHQEN